MQLIVRDDRSGERLSRRVLGDSEPLRELRDYAREFLAAYDIPLAPADGRIPLGCADFTVTLTSVTDDDSNPDADQEACVWASESFFQGE